MAEDKEQGRGEDTKKTTAIQQKPKEPQARDIADSEMDTRVGKLEKLDGSSNTTLNQVRPNHFHEFISIHIPHNPTPQTLLNAELDVITRPGHIHSASRRIGTLNTKEG